MTNAETYDDHADVRAWIDRELVDLRGDKIGTITDVYDDDESGRPEWATVKTGLFGTHVSFVPLDGIQPSGDALASSWTKDQVKDAPRIDADGRLSVEEERELYRYYGRDYDAPIGRSAPRGGGGELGTDLGGDASGPSTDTAMTRSEEELDVSTRRRQAGTVRLRKCIDTEHEQRTVPVSREEVRVEREPITDANVGAAMDGPELSEEEHEMPLYEEEVVAQKTTVPKERVRLDKAVVTDEETVEEDLRKERIEVEGADVTGDAGRGTRP